MKSLRPEGSPVCRNCLTTGENMICLILTMTGGLCAGYILRKCKWLVHIGKAISVTICLMLFIMGIKIGENDSILMNFTTLGWQAFVLAMASLAGSVVFSAILYRLIDSLSSVLISQYCEPSLGAQVAAELGTIALLTNIFRELFTLTAAPLLCKYFSPFAPIASAGATAMDVFFCSFV